MPNVTAPNRPSKPRPRSRRPPGSEGFRSPNRILAATDFSPGARAAFTEACGLARALGAPLVLLHVLAPGQPALLAEDPRPRAALGRLKSAAQEALEEWARSAPADTPLGRPLVKTGIPWQTIVETARQTPRTWIVVGTHGRTGLRRALLGSCAEQVVRHAHGPVVTIRR